MMLKELSLSALADVVINRPKPTQREYFIPRQEVLRLINPEQK